jgi:hypothetical protein
MEKNVIDSIGDSVVLISEDRRVMYANRRTGGSCTRTGWPVKLSG